jgi:hypothetical protein
VATAKPVFSSLLACFSLVLFLIAGSANGWCLISKPLPPGLSGSTTELASLDVLSRTSAQQRSIGSMLEQKKLILMIYPQLNPITAYNCLAYSQPIHYAVGLVSFADSQARDASWP